MNVKITRDVELTPQQPPSINHQLFHTELHIFIRYIQSILSIAKEGLYCDFPVARQSLFPLVCERNDKQARVSEFTKYFCSTIE